jgi:hypothetical protein
MLFGERTHSGSFPQEDSKSRIDAIEVKESRCDGELLDLLGVVAMHSGRRMQDQVVELPAPPFVIPRRVPITMSSQERRNSARSNCLANLVGWRTNSRPVPAYI